MKAYLERFPPSDQTQSLVRELADFAMALIVALAIPAVLACAGLWLFNTAAHASHLSQIIPIPQ